MFVTSRWPAIPRESKENLRGSHVGGTNKEANEESFVIVHQYDGNDVCASDPLTATIISLSILGFTF